MAEDILRPSKACRGIEGSIHFVGHSMAAVGTRLSRQISPKAAGPGSEIGTPQWRSEIADRLKNVKAYRAWFWTGRTSNSSPSAMRTLRCDPSFGRLTGRHHRGKRSIYPISSAMLPRPMRASIG